VKIVVVFVQMGNRWAGGWKGGRGEEMGVRWLHFGCRNICETVCYFCAQGDEPDEDDTFALLTSLKRLQAFWS